MNGWIIEYRNPSKIIAQIGFARIGMGLIVIAPLFAVAFLWLT